MSFGSVGTVGTALTSLKVGICKGLYRGMSKISKREELNMKGKGGYDPTGHCDQSYVYVLDLLLITSKEKGVGYRLLSSEYKLTKLLLQIRCHYYNIIS